MAAVPLARKDRFLAWLAAQVGGGLLRLLFATCRVEVLPAGIEEAFFGAGRPAVGVAWHQGAVFFLWYFGRRRAAVMISRSKDGEYLARFAAHMGCVPVRGSSRKGGSAALLEMARLLREGEVGYAATVADGPQGPRHVAKKGMIALAGATGVPLVPLAWSADRVWVLAKSWDHTMLPKPFAKITVLTGREFAFPPRMTPEELETARREVERELLRIKAEVDAVCGFREPA